MGCDIHPHLEVKINGQWQHYSMPFRDRSYRTFEKICGVRGDRTNAIHLPKGIPEDITDLTKLDLEKWGRDAHNHTWLNKTEFLNLLAWIGDVNDSFSCWSETGSLWEEPEIEDVRFICWFDN